MLREIFFFHENPREPLRINESPCPGCSWLFPGPPEGAQMQFSGPKVCPNTGVLKGTHYITAFDGNGMEANNVVYRAEIQNAASECEYDLNNRLIYNDVGIRGLAERGPALTGNQAALPIFLVVTDPTGSVLIKRRYDVVVTFEDGQVREDFVQTVENLRLPITPDITGASYEILYGFQLSPAQVEFNETHDPVRLY